MFKKLVPHTKFITLPSGFINIRGVSGGQATNGQDLYQYNYRVVDDDFEEEWIGLCDQNLSHSEVRAGAIVSCYESKGLNVAFNLALYHLWMEQTFYWYGRAGDEITHNTLHTIGYGEYAPLVRHYLNRLKSLKVFW